MVYRIASVLILVAATSTAHAEPNATLYGNLPPLAVPELGPDTLALGSEFQIAAGSFQYTASGQANNDVDDEATTLALSVDTRYFRGLEKTQFGYSVIGTAFDTFSRAPAGDDSVITNAFAVRMAPEARVYPMAGSPFFVHGTVDFDLAVNSTITTGDLGTEDSTAPGNVTAALGVGAGRILNVDPIVRLKRLERAMQSEQLLGGDISDAVGTEIIKSWYALRNDFSNYSRLAYSMKHLHDAGLLQGEPNLRATHKAMQVLADPFIVNRRHGWEARGGFGVSQSFVGYDDMDEPDASFALVASGQYELPLATDRQLSILGKAILDLGTTDLGDPSRPWNARGFLTYTQVFYGPYYDPTGAITLSGDAGISGLRTPDGTAGPETGVDLNASAAYSRALNRGSLATGAVNLSARNDGVYALTLSIGITWGIASGFYTPYVGGLVPAH